MQNDSKKLAEAKQLVYLKGESCWQGVVLSTLQPWKIIGVMPTKVDRQRILNIMIILCRVY